MEEQQDSFVGRTIRRRYHLEKRIGVGAFGAVYRATDFETGTACAVKLLRTNQSRRREVSLRFWDEAHFVASLCHPNIVESYDYGEDEDGTLFLCMELLRGQDLEEYLKKRPRISMMEALSIIQQIGSALHSVHLSKMVHRDLKPRNVFVLAERAGNRSNSGATPPLIKVIDFGLAKSLLRQGGDRGSGGLLIGTPDYLAPEAWRSDGQEVDARADQWALAVLTYRLLTGSLPFCGEGDTARTGQVILEATPMPIRSREPSIAEHVERAVDRALSKDRSGRFDSVPSFLRALQGRPLPQSDNPLRACAGSDAASRATVALAPVAGPREGASGPPGARGPSEPSASAAMTLLRAGGRGTTSAEPETMLAPLVQHVQVSPAARPQEVSPQAGLSRPSKPSRVEIGTRKFYAVALLGGVGLAAATSLGVSSGRRGLSALPAATAPRVTEGGGALRTRPNRPASPPSSADADAAEACRCDCGPPAVPRDSGPRPSSPDGRPATPAISATAAIPAARAAPAAPATPLARPRVGSAPSPGADALRRPPTAKVVIF